MKQTFIEYLDSLVDWFQDLPWQKQLFFSIATTILVVGLLQGLVSRLS